MHIPCASSRTHSGACPMEQRLAYSATCSLNSASHKRMDHIDAVMPAAVNILTISSKFCRRPSSPCDVDVHQPLFTTLPQPCAKSAPSYLADARSKPLLTNLASDESKWSFCCAHMAPCTSFDQKKMAPIQLACSFSHIASGLAHRSTSPM